ncbi:hypothetical protein [Burkholderia glumae]|uniref:hypothetical protein n=2 Tax=Burkholderia glumae TaxID=337 RepID=UPI00214F9184|nr:hypothetical protein [Burkholderia glumae]
MGIEWHARRARMSKKDKASHHKPARSPRRAPREAGTAGAGQFCAKPAATGTGGASGAARAAPGDLPDARCRIGNERCASLEAGIDDATPRRRKPDRMGGGRRWCAGREPPAASVRRPGSDGGHDGDPARPAAGIS